MVLSVNRRLLGEVFSELADVSCVIASDKKFEIIFTVDGILSDDHVKDISCIETEIMADFHDNFDISHKIVVSETAAPVDAFCTFGRKRLSPR